jgi:segregation and condensation protein B
MLGLTPFGLTAIAYLQPVTRAEISKLAGREISRDVIAALKRHGLIDGAIRAPQPGAVRLCDDAEIPRGVRLRLLARPPDLEQFKGERSPQAAELDGALGLVTKKMP